MMKDPGTPQQAEVRVILPKKEPNASRAQDRVFSIGRGTPVRTLGRIV